MFAIDYHSSTILFWRHQSFLLVQEGATSSATPANLLLACMAAEPYILQALMGIEPRIKRAGQCVLSNRLSHSGLSSSMILRYLDGMQL